MLADITSSFVLNTKVERIEPFIFLVLTASPQLFSQHSKLIQVFQFLTSYLTGLLQFLITSLYSSHTTLTISAVSAMTPPLTGFFMRAAGLGQMHKEIEKQKRERGMVGYSGMCYSMFLIYFCLLLQIVGHIRVFL